ncbi:MAG: hypothetical protein IJD38_07235 [Clostridia bacterium]|nr:hypothetical protein [Clostridia bacterium]
MYAVFSFYLDPKKNAATRTFHLMLAFLSRQAQGSVTFGTNAENVSGGVGGQSRLLFAGEFGLEAEPRFIFSPTSENISGKETVHSEDQDAQGQSVQNDRCNPESGSNLPEKTEYRSQKQKDQFNREQCIVQIIRSISSAEKKRHFFGYFISFHKHIPFA